MKKLALLLFLLPLAALAQNVRVDIPWTSVSMTSPPFIVAPQSPNLPVVSVCSHPANGIPCSNFATTYTASGTACPNGAQDVPQPVATSSCQSTTDGQGNIGFFIPAGRYDLTVCYSGSCPNSPWTVDVGSVSTPVNLSSPPPIGNVAPNTVAASIGNVNSQLIVGSDAQSGQQAIYLNDDINGVCSYYGGQFNVLDQLSDVNGTLFWNPFGSGGACQQIMTVQPLPIGTNPVAGTVPAWVSTGYVPGAPASICNLNNVETVGGNCATAWGGGDIGAQIANAQAILPVNACGSYGQIRLGTSGTVTLSTPISISGHQISLIGPGKNILSLSCTASVSGTDCIRIQDTAPACDAAAPQAGPTFSGFSLIGHGATGVNGIHFGDLVNTTFSDIRIFGFNDCTTLTCPAPIPQALWFDNVNSFTENTILTNIILVNCTMCRRFSNTSGVAGNASFGYTRTNDMLIQPGAGGVGWCIDGTTDCLGTSGKTNQPVVYHSFFDVAIEEGSGAILPSVPTYLKLGVNAYMALNHYNIDMEDQGGINPVYAVFGAGSELQGFGQVNWSGCSNSKVTGQLAASINIFPAIVCAVNSSSPLTTVPTSAFALTNWGGITAPSSCTGQWTSFTCTIAAATCGTCTTASIAVTFPSSPLFSTTIWDNPPSYVCKNVSVGAGGTLLTISGENSATTAGMTLQAGTVAAYQYVITCNAMLR